MTTIELSPSDSTSEPEIPEELIDGSQNYLKNIPLDQLDTPEQQDEKFEYQVLENPYERMHYVHLTDELISRLDGSDKVNPRPDYVIFLDKSARPVNWMTHALWDTLAKKDDEGNIPKRPQSLFVNIDARRRKDESADAMANLRALFTVEEPLPGTETMNQETILDGKNVLIVDEIKVSGDTIRYADKLLSRAYPSTNFKTFSWMDGSPKTVGGPERNNPRWYERNSDRFRVVVENIDDEAYNAQLMNQDERIRRGWSWLAKTPKETSPSVRMLLGEVKQMAKDIRSGELPYWPSMNRKDEEERIEQFNHVSVQDFDSFRQWMKLRFWPDVGIAGAITDKTGPLSDERAKQEARFNNNVEEFNKVSLTEAATEFKNRFAFTYEVSAVTSLAGTVRRRNRR